jgi:hypothetical protein
MKISQRSDDLKAHDEFFWIHFSFFEKPSEVGLESSMRTSHVRYPFQKGTAWGYRSKVTKGHHLLGFVLSKTPARKKKYIS